MHDLLPITASGWWADDLTLPLAVQLGLWLVRPRSMGLSNALRDRDIHFCEIGEIVDAAKTPDEHPTAVMTARRVNASNDATAPHYSIT